MIKKIKVCFLLTHIPNPRINKRITAMLKANMDVTVVCVRRKAQNIWDPVHTDDIKYCIHDADLPNSNMFIKRAFSYLELKEIFLNDLRELAPDLILTDGFDLLLVSCEYKKKHKKARVIYEVADLRESFFNTKCNFIKTCYKYFLAKMEKQSLKKVDLLLVTSDMFFETHYKNLITRDKVIFIPNIPDVDVFKSYKRKVTGDFTIGFIGGIRYLQQMKMLIDASDIVGCNVLFAGAGGTAIEYEEIQNYCKNRSHVTFTGKYSYEKDISRLYGMCDCVYAVYNADNPNVKIALPNKLYESVLCELPIIVAQTTYLSQIVEKLGIGIAIGHNDFVGLCSQLKRLKTDANYYENFVKNCATNKSKIIQNYQSVLVQKIQSLFAES